MGYFSGVCISNGLKQPILTTSHDYMNCLKPKYVICMHAIRTFTRDVLHTRCMPSHGCGAAVAVGEREDPIVQQF